MPQVVQVTEATDGLVRDLTRSTKQAYAELHRLERLQGTIAQRAAVGVRDQPAPLARLPDHAGHLNALLLARNYLTLVMQAHTLGDQIRREAPRDPKRTLGLYHRLHDLAFAVHTADPHAPWGPCAHLRRFLDRQLTTMWDDIRLTVVRRFIQTLQALEWPKPVPIPAPRALGPRLDDLQQAFADMLLLERPRARGNLNHHAPVLFAIQTLMRPLVVRFQYHFDGPRATNRLDKPEWFLAHVVNAIRDHYPFLEEELQPVLDHSPARAYRVKDEFIRGWIQSIGTKLHHDRARYLEEPLMLAHTVAQLVEFDRTVTEVYFYTPPPAPPCGATSVVDADDDGLAPAWLGFGDPYRDLLDWPGTADALLSDCVLFDRWLDAEKEFAAEQYNQLILDEGAWELLYDDLLDPNDPRPTRSAEALLNLIDGIGQRMRVLPRAAQRVRFLADIQLPILETYLQEVEREVQAYQQTFFAYVTSTATDLAARTTQSAIPTTATARDPADLLHRLTQWCRWLHTCLYMATALRDLADQPYYLDLWAAVAAAHLAAGHQRDDPLPVASLLQNYLITATDRPESPDEFVDALEELSLGDAVDESPSSSDLSSADAGEVSNDDNDEVLDRTVFDEVVAGFEDLARRIQRAVAQALIEDVTARLRPYRKKPNADWTGDHRALLHSLVRRGVASGLYPAAETGDGDADEEVSDDGVQEPGGVSTELRSTLAHLNHALTLLAQHLPEIRFRQCYRDFARAVDDFLVDRVVLSHRFSFGGAAQFAFDVSLGLWPLARPWIAKPANLYRRTRDVVALLTLPPDDHLPGTRTMVQARQTLLASVAPTALASMVAGSPRTADADDGPETYDLVRLADILFSTDRTRPFKLRTLATLGIDQLELEEVQRVLRLRVDLPLAYH
ncbi:hypothetical protein IWQ60_000485 [Tieghemiomyces parasiticus]|uniref:RAD50-interacting protein 1 n=1 Tax=Tieghemiomyces parasiticus TaxID=78921 RepID=A0A9W8DZ58_9FUNG|nr:hypothetical protein IWQ60_000485 [Tieghemiomyces parasiticus]